MMLSEKQQKFTHMVALLILHAEQLGYAVTFGDAYRDKRVPYGSEKSLHRQRLAVDLNLFRDGVVSICHGGPSAAWGILGKYRRYMGRPVFRRQPLQPGA